MWPFKGAQAGVVTADLEKAKGPLGNGVRAAPRSGSAEVEVADPGHGHPEPGVLESWSTPVLLKLAGARPGTSSLPTAQPGRAQ